MEDRDFGVVVGFRDAGLCGDGQNHGRRPREVLTTAPGGREAGREGGKGADRIDGGDAEKEIM